MTVLQPTRFSEAFAHFQRLIAANDRSHPFTNFHEGVAAAWEGYKPRLREYALGMLNADTWIEEDIGSGIILQHVISAIEIQDSHVNLTNNLVFWQNRYGHANRDHRVMLEATASKPLSRQIERLLFDLYRGGSDEGGVFDKLSGLTGAKYPLLAYLYFLKDINRFTPIQPTSFDRAFQALGVDFKTLRSCSWDNYSRYNAVLDQVRQSLKAKPGLANVRLIDAHSFCWLLEKLPDIGVAGQVPRKDAGRVVGGRDRSLIEMRISIENTTRSSNGQTAARIVKNKDLRMSAEELHKLLKSLLTIQQDRCALTGIPFHFHGPDADANLLPSPDRIDSNGHYEDSNIQIVCRFINQWKGASENEEFKRLLMLVRDVAPEA